MDKLEKVTFSSFTPTKSHRSVGDTEPLKGHYDEKIVSLLLISIRHHLNIHFKTFSVSYHLVLLSRYSSFSGSKLKLICDVIFSRIQNET